MKEIKNKRGVDIKKSGIILIDKPKDITSHKVLSILKKNMPNKYGHSGTLDPLATGLLIVLVGDATKISEYLLKQDKEYIAEILLGVSTDSLDITGNEIFRDLDIENKEHIFDKEYINNYISTFKGKIKQIPPIYSALKYNGKKLYEIARENNKNKSNDENKECENKILSDKEIEKIQKEKEREIEIYDIKLLNISKERKTIEIKVKCSSGTYIRTLAEDIAKKLGTYGCIQNLRRTSVGSLNVSQGYSLEDILEKGFDEKVYIKAQDVLKDIIKEKIYLEKSRIIHFINGVRCSVDNSPGIYMIYEKESGKFIGIGEVKDKKVKRKYIDNN